MAQVPLFCITTAMEIEMNWDEKEKHEPITKTALKESRNPSTQHGQSILKRGQAPKAWKSNVCVLVVLVILLVILKMDLTNSYSLIMPKERNSC